MLHDLIMYDVQEKELLKAVPELKELISFKDGKVWKHTLLTVKNAHQDIEVKLACLLHDIGKPQSYRVVNGKDAYHGHQQISSLMALSILKRCNYDEKTIKNVQKLILDHMSKGAKFNSNKSIKRLIRRIGEDLLDKLLHVFKADVMGYETYNLKSYNEVKRKLKEFRETPEIPVFKPSEYYAVNGNDLIKLGIIGKQIGVILKELQHRVDIGEENNKAYLLRIAKEMINEDICDS